MYFEELNEDKAIVRITFQKPELLKNYFSQLNLSKNNKFSIFLTKKKFVEFKEVEISNELNTFGIIINSNDNFKIQSFLTGDNEKQIYYGNQTIALLRNLLIKFSSL